LAVRARVRGQKQRSTHDEHLPEGRAELRHRSRQYWEERADRLSPDVGSFVREVFESDDVLLQLRTVQAIVSYLEKSPVERASAAARRASFYGSHTYQAVKNVLTRALDLEPLPTTKAKPAWADSVAALKPRSAGGPVLSTKRALTQRL
jgi:hypothetical protein